MNFIIKKKNNKLIIIIIKLENYKIIETQIKDLSDKIERILFILESDDKTKTKGLVERTSNNQDDINELKTFNRALKIRVSTVGAISAFLTSIVLWFAKLIFLKT